VGAVWAATRAGEAGEIRLQAQHDRLGTAAVTILSREAK
jgi:hypothetical protein